MNILMKSRSSPIVGKIRLIAMIFSKPSTPYDLALNTSAMPPTLMRSSSKYFPKGTGCLTRSDGSGGPSAITTKKGGLMTWGQRQQRPDFVGCVEGKRGRTTMVRWRQRRCGRASRSRNWLESGGDSQDVLLC